MADNKDYSKLAPEELLAKEKKLKRSEILSAMATGFLIGIMLYGVAKNGFGFLYIFIPLGLIIANQKYFQNIKQQLKQIRTEIDKRKIN
jgi:uncharacterized membrane protein